MYERYETMSDQRFSAVNIDDILFEDFIDAYIDSHTKPVTKFRESYADPEATLDYYFLYKFLMDVIQYTNDEIAGRLEQAVTTTTIKPETVRKLAFGKFNKALHRIIGANFYTKEFIARIDIIEFMYVFGIVFTDLQCRPTLYNLDYFVGFDSSQTVAAKAVESVTKSVETLVQESAKTVITEKSKSALSKLFRKKSTKKAVEAAVNVTSATINTIAAVDAIAAAATAAASTTELV